MFVDQYATYIDPVERLHREQVRLCGDMLKRHEEMKASKIKPRPALQDYGFLWPRDYDPTPEDVADIKLAYQQGRPVPHQIVDLVIAKAARLDDPSVFLGKDFPRQFGRQHFYTPERYNAEIHPKEISMLLSGGSGQDVLTSVWLERAAQAPEPGLLARLHRRVTSAEPGEYAKTLAFRLLKPAHELVGPPREVFNRHDDFFQMPQGSYRALMTENGHDRAIEIMGDFDRARKQEAAERGAREMKDVMSGKISSRVRVWFRDSLSLHCGPGGY